MRVLITGAAGFIGFHTSLKLLNEGHEVIGFDNLNYYYSPSLKAKRIEILKTFKAFKFILSDLKNLDDIEDEFDSIIHLAAQAGVRHSLKHPEDYIESNIIGFFKVCELAKKRKVTNLVYASSSSVYGSNMPPFAEANATNYPLSLYAATKISNEAMAKSYGHMHDLNSTGLRFFTVYGPWGRPDMFMWIAAEKLLRDEPINLNGLGIERDFTYVDDIVSGILLSLKNPNKNKIYNLGYGKSHSLIDVIQKLKEGLNLKSIDINLRLKDMQRGDVLKNQAETISLAQKELGWIPKTEINNGVKEFCKWFLQKEF